MKYLIYVAFFLVYNNCNAQFNQYTYDNLGRLTQAQYTNGTSIQYSYDANGNRLQHIVNNNATSIDLNLSGLGLSTTSVSAGNVVNVNVVNNNTGSSACSGQNIIAYLSTDTILSASDIVLNTYYVSSVASLGYANINNWSVTIPSGTSVGTYFVILKTDANNSVMEINENNNTIFSSITIAACPLITIAETITSTTCGTANGSIVFTPSNGATPYQYSINNGTNFQTNNSFTNLATNSYSCIVKDANGCSQSKIENIGLVGGNATIPNYTYNVNGQTVAFTNTSQNATNYLWNFGDGTTTTAINPTHTFAGTCSYNVCLTASNTCGSNTHCENVIASSNFVAPSAFPKMYWNIAKEVNIVAIRRSNQNDGWIIIMDMSLYPNSSTFNNSLKIVKIDTIGNLIWHKEIYNSTSTSALVGFRKLMQYKNNYCIYGDFGNSNLIEFDDNGNYVSSFNYPSVDLVVGGNYLFYLNMGATFPSYNSDIVNITAVDLNYPTAKLWEKAYGLGGPGSVYSMIQNYQYTPNIYYSKNNEIIVYGTYYDINIGNNPRYMYALKVDSSYGNYIWANKFNTGQKYDLVTGISEDMNNDYIFSTRMTYPWNGPSMLFKINNQYGNVTGACVADGILNINSSNKYFLRSGSQIAKTDNNFLPILSKGYNTGFQYYGFLIEPVRNETFLLCSKFSNLNVYSNGMNVIGKLDSNINLSNNCMYDSLCTNPTFTAVSMNQYYQNPQGIMNFTTPSISQTSFSFYASTLLDSNQCTITPCNTTASFIKSKSTACIGDIITFTNTSSNSSSLLWRINGVNSGTSSSIQKNFNTAGEFKIQLIANNGNCHDTTDFVYSVSPLLTLALTNTNNQCGLNNGSISINNTGGTSPFTYSINNGVSYSSNNTYSSLSSATYTVVAIDALGCSASANTTITTVANPNFVITSNGDIPNCSSICDGLIITSSSGGVSPYTYSISPLGSQNTPGSFSNLCANNIYTITSTDASGCIKTSTRVILQDPLPSISVVTSPTNISCAGNTVSLTATGASTYVWEPGTLSGASINVTPSYSTTYTITGTSSNGCTSTATQLITVESCGNSIVTLKLFIEGYYLGNGMMDHVAMNESYGVDTNSTDSIVVELRDINSPFGIFASTKTDLKTNGLAFCDFPISGTFYIAVKHRNALLTWSANPVSLISGSSNSYDFTNAISKAYGNNMVNVGPGVFAIYSGDLNDDENIDLVDLGILENDILNFEYGYFATDINGDGNVDILDTPIMENNVSDFIFSSHP